MKGMAQEEWKLLWLADFVWFCLICWSQLRQVSRTEDAAEWGFKKRNFEDGCVVV